MPKRKREDEASGPAPSAHQQRFIFKLDQATATLASAFKLAKGFERQKLGRRRKTAAADPGKTAEEVYRIDAEVKALKGLEHAALAKTYLYKTLLKSKAVASSSSLPEQVKAVPKAAEGEKEVLNLTARLCNSNPVREALGKVLGELYKALGVKEEVKVTGKKQRVRAKDYAAAEEGTKAVKNGVQAIPVMEDSDDEDDDGGVELGGSDSDDEDAIESYDARLASDSDSGSGSSSTNLKSRTKLLRRQPSQEPMSDSDSDSKPDSPPPRPNKSSFLPSLTLGGYISGSASDLDSDDVAPSRKKRRGQKARQAIAEKKFGAKAKHLQAQAVKATGVNAGSIGGDRSSGWDGKKGAVESNGRGRGGGRGGRGGESSRGGGAVRGRGGYSAGMGHVETRAATVTEKPRHDDQGAIHPSWAAAKKAKEARAASGPVAFQGRKIVFD